MKNLPENLVLQDGRTLKLAELDPGDVLDLIEASGSAASKGSGNTWMGYAQIIALVRAIDDRPIPFPTTKSEVKALGRSIGTQGFKELEALIEKLAEAEERDESEQREAAKN